MFSHLFRLDSTGPGGDGGMYSMMKPVGPGGQLSGVC